jgi:hypothetical protein
VIGKYTGLCWLMITPSPPPLPAPTSSSAWPQSSWHPPRGPSLPGPAPGAGAPHVVTVLQYPGNCHRPHCAVTGDNTITRAEGHTVACTHPEVARSAGHSASYQSWSTPPHLGFTLLLELGDLGGATALRGQSRAAVPAVLRSSHDFRACHKVRLTRLLPYFNAP